MSETITFLCPRCQTESRLDRALAGSRAPCPECGESVDIIEHRPAAEPAGEAPPQLPALPPPPPPYVGIEEPPPVDDFDPYYRWLAIPKGEQPANHYRLLGLPHFESDPDVILNSSERQMAHVKAQAGGRHVVIGQRLLSELSLARICLLDPARKAEYDAGLRVRLQERARAREQEAAASRRKRSAALKPGGVALDQSARPPEAEPVSPAALSDFFDVNDPSAPPVQGRWKGGPEAAPAPDAEDEPPDDVVFKKHIIEGEMDMTPMIDVTFLLLIFFICTATFALQMTKPIPTPQEDEPSTNATVIEDFEDNPDNITVRIDAFNTFRVITPDTDDEAPSLQELILKLRAARRPGPDGKIPTTLMVIANGQALHEKVVQALDAGTEVGMENMQLMTVENDDE